MSFRGGWGLSQFIHLFLVMKLHLPSGLRKALLACLAAVALPAASIPSTIASASGIAAVFLAASQRAEAEFTGPEGVEWEGSAQEAKDISDTVGENGYDVGTVSYYYSEGRVRKTDRTESSPGHLRELGANPVCGRADRSYS